MNGSACVAAASNCTRVSRSPISCSLAQSAAIVSSCVYSRRPFVSSECMNEFRTAPSTVLRNSVRGIRNAWTFTPSAYSERPVFSTFLSSMVTSTRSMSDFAQTVSCDRLPQRMAAKIDRSFRICATRSSSASVNFFWMDSAGWIITLAMEANLPFFR